MQFTLSMLHILTETDALFIRPENLRTRQHRPHLEGNSFRCAIRKRKSDRNIFPQLEAKSELRGRKLEEVAHRAPPSQAPPFMTYSKLEM